MAGFSLALGATAGDFHGDFFGPEGYVRRRGFYRPSDLRCVQLKHVAAFSADQEGAPVVLTGMGAAGKCVQGGNPVYQTVLQQEVQSPVHGGWGSVMALGAQHGKNVVGPERLVRLPDQFQNPLTDGCEAGILLSANGPGIRQGLADTGLVVVRAIRKRAFRHSLDPAKFATL